MAALAFLDGPGRACPCTPRPRRAGRGPKRTFIMTPRARWPRAAPTAPRHPPQSCSPVGSLAPAPPALSLSQRTPSFLSGPLPQAARGRSSACCGRLLCSIRSRAFASGATPSRSCRRNCRRTLARKQTSPCRRVRNTNPPFHCSPLAKTLLPCEGKLPSHSGIQADEPMPEAAVPTKKHSLPLSTFKNVPRTRKHPSQYSCRPSRLEGRWVEMSLLHPSFECVWCA